MRAAINTDPAAPIFKYAGIAELLERSPDLLERYPRLMVESFVEHLTISEKPKDAVEREIQRRRNKEAKPSEIRSDMIEVLEAAGFSLVPLIKKAILPALTSGWSLRDAFGLLFRRRKR